MNSEKFPIIKIITSLVINYVQYFFITGVVFALALPFMIITDATIGLGNLTLPWLRHFSFIFPKLKDPSISFSFDLNDIMLLFNIFIIILLIIGKATKYFIFRKIEVLKNINIRRPWLVGMIVITIIFIVSRLFASTIDYAPDSNSQAMNPIFIAFYVVTIISYSGYSLLAKLNKKLADKK